MHIYKRMTYAEYYTSVRTFSVDDAEERRTNGKKRTLNDRKKIKSGRSRRRWQIYLRSKLWIKREKNIENEKLSSFLWIKYIPMKCRRTERNERDRSVRLRRNVTKGKKSFPCRLLHAFLSSACLFVDCWMLDGVSGNYRKLAGNLLVSTSTSAWRSDWEWWGERWGDHRYSNHNKINKQNRIIYCRRCWLCCAVPNWWWRWTNMCVCDNETQWQLQCAAASQLPRHWKMAWNNILMIFEPSSFPLCRRQCCILALTATALFVYVNFVRAHTTAIKNHSNHSPVVNDGTTTFLTLRCVSLSLAWTTTVTEEWMKKTKNSNRKNLFL